MRDILSKRDLRQLQLLEFLVKNKQNWVLLKDISKDLNTPIRTIHSDIKEINTYINPIYIKSSSSGVRISIPPNYSERYLYKKILEESREFKIIESVFMNEGETIESLSDKLYISLSTIKRMMREINLILEKEGFSIQRKPLSLLGDERKLIQFMSFYFSEKYPFQEEFMTDHQKALIVRLIDSILKEKGKVMYFPNLKRISTWIYLRCVRLKTHHDLPMSQESKFQNNILGDEKFCREFFEAFEICLTDKAIKQLFYTFSSEEYVFNIDELDRLVQKDEHQKLLYQEIKGMLKNISVQLNIPLRQGVEEKLLLDLINIINMTGYRSFILYDRREYFLSELSVNYIYVREMIKNYLQKNISLGLTEDGWNELNYILLTHWSELYHKMRFIETPIKVFLLIDTDIEHACLLKNELETYSRYNIEVENITNYSLEQLHALSADNILITNMPGINNVNCSILCFGEFLSSRDWKEFNRLMENILVYRKMYDH